MPRAGTVLPSAVIHCRKIIVLIAHPMGGYGVGYLGSRNPRLHTDEILIALSISAAGDDAARLALAQLPKLKGCEVHSTVILSSVDVNIFKKLGMYLTCEPTYETKRMFH